MTKIEELEVEAKSSLNRDAARYIRGIALIVLWSKMAGQFAYWYDNEKITRETAEALLK